MFADTFVPSSTNEGDTTIYYLYNVEAEGFIYAGEAASHQNTWSSNAILSSSGHPIIVMKYLIPGETEEAEPTWDGKTWVIKNYHSSQWWDYFINSDIQILNDHRDQANYMWEIESLGNSEFLIHPSPLNPVYNPEYFKTLEDSEFSGFETYCLGFADFDEEYTLNGTKPLWPALPLLDPSNEMYNSLHLKWAFVSEEKMNTYQSEMNRYNAAMELAQLIEATQNDYPNILLEDYLQVFSNTSSTLDDINQAITQLNAERKESEKFLILDGASEDDPRDATTLIENPSFDQNGSQSKTVNGWVRTVTNATNNQQSKDAHNYSSIDGQYKIQKFLEVWKRSGDVNTAEHEHPLGNGEISQTITNLPNGKWKFTCDAIAVCQITAESEFYYNPCVGIQLFAKGGDVETSQDIHTPYLKVDGKWTSYVEHYEITFVSSGGDMTLGVRIVDTNATWVALDNFTLTYYGEVNEDPFKVALDAVIANCESKYSEGDEIYANEEIKQAYFDELNNAKSLTEGYDEERQLLLNAMTALEASVNEYKTFKSYIDDAEATRTKQDGIRDELAGFIGDLTAEWLDLYENGEAVSEDISKCNGVVRKMVVDYITENLQAGDDITELLLNPAFDANVSNWSYTTKQPAWGGNGTNSYATETITTGNAEVYHSAFSTYQIIRNLKPGVYTVSCQAFERNDDGYVDFYAISPQYGITASLFANDDEALIQNILAGAQEVQIQDDDVTTAENLYIPNTMTGVNYYFNQLGVYGNKIYVNLAEGCDSIKLGIKTDAANSWVIFDDFKVQYLGTSKEVYGEYIDTRLACLNGLLEKAESFGIDAKAGADAAVVALTEAKEGDDIEKCLEAINMSKTAESYIYESIEAYSSLNEKKDQLAISAEEYLEIAPAYAYETAINVVNKAFDASDNRNLNVEQVKELCVQIDNAIIGLQLPDYSQASDETPVNMTAAITNPTFDNTSYEGWSGSGYGSGGDTAPCAERYDMTFDTWQQLSGLPAGTYKVSVQGYYRRGSSANDYAIYISEKPDSALNCFFYVETEVDGEIAIPVRSICEGAVLSGNSYGGSTAAVSDSLVIPNTMEAANYWFQVTDENNEPLYYMHHIICQVGNDGKLKIGTKKSVAIGSDWAIFDNFQLTYYGPASSQQSTTDIEEAVATIDKASGWFDLNGRRVKGGSALPRGLYIVDGKKVFIK